MVAAYIYSLVPEFLLRFLAWMLVHTFYRIRLVHAERIPEDGAAVLVCNHVSFVDAIVHHGGEPAADPLRDGSPDFQVAAAGWVFRHAKAIPIAPRASGRGTAERAYDALRAGAADGDLVCIFPEGKLTRTGDINPFRHGITEIIRRTSGPGHSHGAARLVGQRVFSRATTRAGRGRFRRAS